VTLPPQVIDVSFARTESSVTGGGDDSGGSSSQQTSGQLTMMANIAVKRIRLPSKAAQMHRAEAVQKKRRMHDAFKRATIMYSCQQEKPDGMSAREVVNLIERDLGIKLSECSIQQKVRDGNIETSPLQRGPKGFIPDCHYQNLCIAYESFVSINQLNGKLCTCRPKRVGPLLHRVIYGDASNGNWLSLFKRMQNNTATNLRQQQAKSAEDRRVLWTTHQNISVWFDNWENDIVELGFGTQDQTTGKVHIPYEQLRWIGPFNKTCLLLNGSNSVRGGHPDCII
jgi:hypothetical protein